MVRLRCVGRARNLLDRPPRVRRFARSGAPGGIRRSRPTSDKASVKPNAEAKLAWILLRRGSVRKAKVAPTNAQGYVSLVRASLEQAVETR